MEADEPASLADREAREPARTTRGTTNRACATIRDTMHQPIPHP